MPFCCAWFSLKRNALASSENMTVFAFLSLVCPAKNVMAKATIFCQMFYTSIMPMSLYCYTLFILVLIYSTTILKTYTFLGWVGRGKGIHVHLTDFRKVSGTASAVFATGK